MASLLTSSAEQTIALCEQGVYEPHEGSTPIDLLARGIVESATGDLDTAKDLLSRAYWSLDGDWKTKAGVQLSVAYWRGGENSEAWALLDSLPTTFDVLLTRAIIKTDSDPQLALTLLDQAEEFDVSRFMWGRLHNQRGICLRLLGDLDRAKEEYEAALYFLADCPLRPLVENNLAGVLKAPTASVAAIDQAISKLSGPHLGQAYERKARMLLGEGKTDRALEYSDWSVDLLSAAERRGWLIEALLTRAEINESVGQLPTAVYDLDRALEMAQYLNDEERCLRSLIALHRLSRTMSKTYHVRSVQLAVDQSDTLNSAAQKLGTSRQALKEFMQAHSITHRLRPRKSIIKNI